MKGGIRRPANGRADGTSGEYGGRYCCAPRWSCSSSSAGRAPRPRTPPSATPTPRDGSVLKSAPRQITLTFTESVALLDDSFRVFDPDGRRVSTGEAKHVDGRSDAVRVSLPEGLGEGTFTVAWRVVSADSHPISGAFTFSVGEPSATPAAVDTGPTENTATSALYDIVRYLAYAAWRCSSAPSPSSSCAAPRARTPCAGWS